MRVENKTIMITGAASGIGRGLALEAADRNATLVLTDIDQDGLAETLRLVCAERHTSAHTAHLLDVSRLEDWRSVIQDIQAEHAHLDGLINNAGISFLGTVEDTTYDHFSTVMSVNFMGVVFGTKEVLPLLKTRPEAFIANVSSVFGVYPMKKHGAYCASKYAVSGFTGVLQQELKSTAITVSSIHPGHIATNVARNALEAGNVVGDTLPQAHQDYFLNAFETNGLPPREAAQIILDGLAKKRRQIFVGKDAERADWQSRFQPQSFVDQINDETP